VERFDDRLAQRLAYGAALVGGLPVDIPFDIEDGVDPADHFKGDGRDHHGLLARGLAPSGLFDIGEDEERPPRVAPAAGLQNLAWLAIWRIELAIAAEGVGLENP